MKIFVRKTTIQVFLWKKNVSSKYISNMQHFTLKDLYYRLSYHKHIYYKYMSKNHCHLSSICVFILKKKFISISCRINTNVTFRIELRLSIVELQSFTHPTAGAVMVLWCHISLLLESRCYGDVVSGVTELGVTELRCYVT